MESTTLLANVAMMLFVIGFTVKDIFWLRIITVFAIFLETLYLYIAPSEPLWIYINWNTAFILANGFNIILLLRERNISPMSVEETELYETMFSKFSKLEFMKLIRAGKWKKVKKGALLAENGKNMQHIQFIYNGIVDIEKDEKSLGQLKDGQFIGEMSFVSGKPATATAVAYTDTRLIEWSQSDLKQLLERNPSLSYSLQQLFSMDLLKKLTE